MGFPGTDGGFRVVLKRNCSISPAALLRVYLAFAAVPLAIGVGFAFAGAWMVLPFAGIEIAALGLAFVLNGWHAGDYERIELEGDGLSVEVASGVRTQRHEFDRRRASVVAGPGAALFVRDRTRMLEIGRHLDAQGRDELRAELAKRLQNCR